ncbi:MAG: TRAP transporter substrate-binding protein DctP [Pseudomonadales bacterium]|nr:TRAP transporter substrate-binding protein DctP [Pseudomonadales bacterium]
MRPELKTKYPFFKVQIATWLLILLALTGLTGCDQKPLLNHVVYSVYTTPGHPTAKFGLKPWLAAIQSETQPQITTQLYPAASIVGKGTVSAIRTGLIDGGLIANIYTPDELPVSMVMTNLAFFDTNSLATAGAINEFMLLECPECDAEFAAQGIQFLGTYAASPYNLMCKQEVVTTADLAGLKVRSAGPVFGRWIQSIGAVPVTMANAHAYEALERGMLDCVMGSTAWLKSLSLWDMTKTIVDVPMGTFFGGSLFNIRQEKWHGFSQQQKQTIIRLTPKAIADTVIAYRTESSAAETIALTMGINKVTGDAVMEQRLKEYRQTLLKHSIFVGNKRGVDNAEQLANRFLATLARWEALIGDKQWDNESYAELIWQQIHSKKIVN